MTNRMIFYIMHVDWHWIKQRPQFIAEQLGLNFELIVFHALSRSRNSLAYNQSDIRKHPIVLLPDYVPVIDILITLIHKIYFTFFYVFFRPEAIWVTHPLILSYLPSNIIKKSLIFYDCMDDMISFSAHPKFVKQLAKLEKELIKASSKVFCSSENIAQKLLDRGAEYSKLVVVRNAFDGNVLPTDRFTTSVDIFRICYVGTVSEWIDFEALLASLEEIPDLEYHVIGPICCDVPQHKRLFLHGTINHSELFEETRQYDAFVMPFRITPLIESVDPVKLYEYLNFNRPIIAVRYSEIERFDGFVDFYSSKNELISVIREVRNREKLKYSLDERCEFLAENTWSKRCDEICAQLFMAFDAAGKP